LRKIFDEKLDKNRSGFTYLADLNPKKKSATMPVPFSKNKHNLLCITDNNKPTSLGDGPKKVTVILNYIRKVI
jgi:hypothetical protein